MTEHIQINAVEPRTAYVADGVQSAFTYPFAIFRPEDLEVWLDAVRQTAGITVSGAGVSTGGTALFAVPPPAGVRVTLRRRMAIARTSDFQADGVIRAKTLNDEFDIQIAAIQQVADDAARAVGRAVTSGSAADLTLPEPAPGKAIGWNGDGSGLTNDPADFVATVTSVSSHADTATAQALIAAAQAEVASTGAATAITKAAEASASAAAAAASATAAEVARIEWRGGWSAATAYAVNDAVSHGGASWICTQAHTDQTPADNSWWDPLAAKGTDGSGAGDLLAANNLSDLASAATARTNLGAAAASHPHVSADLTDFAEAAQDVVGAMIAAAGGSYDDTAGTIALPDGTAQAVLDRLAFLETNLAVTVLRDQIDTGWSVLKMAGGVADEFEDETGIGSLVNGTYDNAEDYVHNPIQSVVPQAAGTPIGNMTQGGGLAAAFDGTTNQTMNAGAYTNGSQTPSGRRYGYIGKDWGAGHSKVISGFVATGASDHGFKESSTPTIVCTLLGSATNDPTTATNLGSAAGVTDATGLVIAKLSGLSVSSAYRFHWIRIDTAADGGENVNIAELILYESPGSNDMEIVSTATTAQAQPSEARLVLLHQPIDAVTLNTDVTVEVSRDSGTTWNAGTLVDQGAFDATIRILSATIDLSAQPAGTAMKWRFKTFNAKEQRLHGVWMQWR
jgi:hypothetical protein